MGVAERKKTRLVLSKVMLLCFPFTVDMWCELYLCNWLLLSLRTSGLGWAPRPGEQTACKAAPRLLLHAGLHWGLPSRAAGHPGLLTHNGGRELPSGEGPKQEVGSLLPKVRIRSRAGLR